MSDETKDIAGENIDLRREIERLKAGDFTPEEFQALCHNLHLKEERITPQAFCDGCEAYQVKLFGESPIANLKAEKVALDLRNDKLAAECNARLKLQREAEERTAELERIYDDCMAALPNEYKDMPLSMADTIRALVEEIERLKADDSASASNWDTLFRCFESITRQLLTSAERQYATVEQQADLSIERIAEARAKAFEECKAIALDGFDNECASYGCDACQAKQRIAEAIEAATKEVKL